MRSVFFEEDCFFFHGGFPQTVYFLECYKFSIFETIKMIDFWKCLQIFLFSNWTLSLFLSLSLKSFFSLIIFN